MNTCVAVHGSGAGKWYWDDVAPLIEKRGYDIVVVDQLPSIGTDPEALGDHHADAAYVRNVVEAVDGPVCLVGYAYGGVVVTELVDHPACATVSTWAARARARHVGSGHARRCGSAAASSSQPVALSTGPDTNLVVRDR